MDNILHLNLKPQNAERVYTADVYSYDMKKYQFQQVARTANAAYYAFVDTALKSGVQFIRCIAIYDCAAEARHKDQAPIKVWQQQDPTADKLVEF